MSTYQILQEQKAYFRSGATLSASFRKKMLLRLHDVIEARQQDVAAALKEDLGKSSCESYMCEIGMVLEELTYMASHVKKFSAEHRVRTPLSQFAARSYEKPSPYGNVLIMSPWNYPFLLTMGPLADALAAGNTAVIKPSAYSPATGRVIESLIDECFPSQYVAVVTGGRKENAALLSEEFNFIFFTGSQNVGREVLRHTAESLTPAVLELGGKSPCIVDETAKLSLAAKRIVFGKFLNCGQTCVAPDYILCQENVKPQLIEAIKKEIEAQYGPNALLNEQYGKIINRKHFDRISRLIDPYKVVFGGQSDSETLQISPTVMDHVNWNDPVMGEEIFGPVLPVLSYRQPEEIIDLLAEKPKPLALYVFSQNRSFIKEITERCSFGGGCVNDTVIHLATTRMGFGGVGESGMGAYHGKAGFDTFSHTKSIVNKKTWIDLPVRYAPYGNGFKEKILHMFMK